MDFFNWLKNLFTKKEELVFTDSSLEHVRTILPQITSFEAEPVEIDFPHWLSNEDALRDEGVIFGLTETKPEEKLKIIEAIFLKKTSFLDKKREELFEKIDEFNLKIEKVKSKSDKIENICTNIENQNPSDENLLRVIIGLIISIGMACGNYYLIDTSITPALPQSHKWIAWGVFLTGMFSLFNPISILHSKEEKLNWKNILEEFGIPFAASLFVFVQAYDFQPWYKSSALFLFVFFAFLVAGKILLSNIARLKAELRIFNTNQKLKSDKSKLDHEWLFKKNNLELQIDAIRIEKWKVIPELNKIEAELAQIKNEKEALIGIFMSEFNLAKSYKDKLKPNQIKNIVG